MSNGVNAVVLFYFAGEVRPLLGGVILYKEIVNAADRLKRRYRETNPFKLCEAMGIKLLFRSLGTEPDSVKGFFFECKRIRTITVNADLPEIVQMFIVAHELGHAVLHRDHGLSAFQETALYDESSVREKEANLFAAELLLDDEEVLQTLNQDNTFFSAAARLCVPAELLDFKFRIMKRKGYKLAEPPVIASNCFFRDLEIPLQENYKK